MHNWILSFQTHTPKNIVLESPHGNIRIVSVQNLKVHLGKENINTWICCITARKMQSAHSQPICPGNRQFMSIYTYKYTYLNNNSHSKPSAKLYSFLMPATAISSLQGYNFPDFSPGNKKPEIAPVFPLFWSLCPHSELKLWATPSVTGRVGKAFPRASWVHLQSKAAEAMTFHPSASEPGHSGICSLSFVDMIQYDRAH